MAWTSKFKEKTTWAGLAAASLSLLREQTQLINQPLCVSIPHALFALFLGSVGWFAAEAKKEVPCPNCSSGSKHPGDGSLSESPLPSQLPCLDEKPKA